MPNPVKCPLDVVPRAIAKALEIRPCMLCRELDAVHLGPFLEVREPFRAVVLVHLFRILAVGVGLIGKFCTCEAARVMMQVFPLRDLAVCGNCVSISSIPARL